MQLEKHWLTVGGPYWLNMNECMPKHASLYQSQEISRTYGGTSATVLPNMCKLGCQVFGNAVLQVPPQSAQLLLRQSLKQWYLQPLNDVYTKFMQH